MSADLMRRAAERMRQRADAKSVPDGPWSVAECHPETRDESRVLGTHSVVYAGDTIHAYVKGMSTERQQVAEHIAAWDPLMARVTAELLEAGAAEIDRRVARDGVEVLERANPVFHAMTELARTYLHEEG